MTNSNPLVVSHLTLRRMVGIVGLTLPIILWTMEQRTSISNYYYGGMRDYLVGALVAIGAFLLAYNGYDRRDKVAGRVAGVAAILVAFCPHLDPVYRALHFGAAVVFLGALAYISLALFTQSGGQMTDRKKTRNAVYRVCGYLILAGVLGTVAGVVLGHSVFWWEALAVMAFGVSWIVKGEAILADV